MEGQGNQVREVPILAAMRLGWLSLLCPTRVRSEEQLCEFIEKIQVYAIGDQVSPHFASSPVGMS